MLKEIEQRKSVRTFSDKKINDVDLKEILNAGIIAPSWVNVQPWKFIVVKDEKLRDEVNKMCMSQSHVVSASDVVLVIADVSAWKPENFSKVLEKNPRFRDVASDIANSNVYNPSLLSPEIAMIRTVEQCAYAIENMVLQAESLGVSSCIIGACSNEFTMTNPQQHQIVRDMLKLDDGMFIFNAIALGYNSMPQIPNDRLRKEFDEVVSVNVLGNSF